MKKSLLALSFLLLVPTVHAADATLKAAKGSVAVRRPGGKQFVALKPGQALKTNDRIRTGPGAIAQISFKSGATMLVKENSKLALRRDKRGSLVAFDVGEFLIGLKNKLTGSDRFRVSTPVAVAAVRGTSFWGKADEQKNSTYACFTGQIEVWSNGKSEMLNPGKKLTVSADQKISTPEDANIPPDFIQTFAVDGSLQGVDDVIRSESH